MDLTRQDALWIGAALLALSALQVSQSLFALGLFAPIAVPLAAVCGSLGIVAWALGLFDDNDDFYLW